MPADLNQEIIQTLGEAAMEIANLAGPDNIVCQRVRALQRKLLPLNVTAGELARRLDISPGEVFEAAAAVGVRPFWHEGRRFRDAELMRDFLGRDFHGDRIEDVEFDLPADLAELLAVELGTSVEELRSDSPAEAVRSGVGPRKFIASDSRLPNQAETKRRYS